MAAKSALSMIGEGAFLRGTVACKVNIEYGVQLAGIDENMVVDKDIAHIEAVHSPKVGDTLAHPDGNFILDALLEDKGAFKRFIVLKV